MITSKIENMGLTVKQKMIVKSKKAEGAPRVPFGALLNTNPKTPSGVPDKKKKNG